MSFETIQYLKTNALTIRTGIVMCGPFIVDFNEPNFPDDDEPMRVGVGSVYELGNGSCSLIKFQPSLGPLYGNSLSDSEIVIPDCKISNIVSTLIPGMYPAISGPSRYSYAEVLDEIQSSQNYFTKILGFGKGHTTMSFQLAEPDISGVSILSQNVLQLIFTGNLASSGVIPQSEILKLENYSTIYPEFVYPLTITGVPDYLTRFESWVDSFGVKKLYGTNEFPSFGWAGSRLGAAFLGTSQTQRDTQVNYPATFLEYSKSYEKIGVLYAGQAAQLTNSGTAITVLPYQQGRGIYDYYSIETQLAKLIETILPVQTTMPLLTVATTFGPEGIQPGRNNACIGVALTTYFSTTLDLKNQSFASKTPQDTRCILYTTPPPINVQATNAPMAYFPPATAEQNVLDPLPWNSLNAYISSTTESARNILSAKVPILRDGITTMCISGAYPLYRGSHATEYSGFICAQTTQIVVGHIMFPQYLSWYLSQYYLTEQFWDPNFNIENNFAASFEDFDIPVSPNPPYYIKGARIMLYENQYVLAGSYVYTSMNMVGNVTMSPFVSASTKELKYVQGQNTNLLQDPYGKFQGNQGGIIVVVQTEGQDPLMVPDCCQPIGVILETIRGSGPPISVDENNQIMYTHQAAPSTGQQVVPEFENTTQLQSREVKIRLFPMYGNIALSGYPSLTLRTQFTTSLDITSGQPFTNNSFFQPEMMSNITTDPDRTTSTVPCGGLYQKIRTLYTLHDSPFSYITTNNRFQNPDVLLEQIINYPYPYNEAGIRGKQFMNDYYGPESKWERSLVYSGF